MNVFFCNAGRESGRGNHKPADGVLMDVQMVGALNGFHTAVALRK